MTTFVDTSALYALLDEDDDNHPAASAWFAGQGADPDELLLSHNYVIVEATALVHRRLGGAAVRALFDIVAALSLVYVDEPLHARATAAYLAALRRRVSFVDWVSFQVMRDGNVQNAFAFDADFRSEGFTTVPRRV